MKTAEEIFEEVYQIGCDGWISYEQAIKAMKMYANEKLDEASEHATIIFTDILYNSEVDKESITKFKDEI